MKRIGKKFMILALSMTLLLGFSVTVCAAEDNNVVIIQAEDRENLKQQDRINIEPGGISTFAEAHCGRYATHDMLSRGWGSIYKSDGTCVVYMGACHQCTRCNLVFISEGEPLSIPLGHWATCEADSAVTNVTFLTTDNIHYTTSKTIEGLSFRY